jgi:hypothetical protein
MLAKATQRQMQPGAAVIPNLEPGMSVAAARRALTSAFAAAGLDTPDLDARVLVGHALGLLKFVLFSD